MSFHAFIKYFSDLFTQNNINLENFTSSEAFSIFCAFSMIILLFSFGQLTDASPSSSFPCNSILTTDSSNNVMIPECLSHTVASVAEEFINLPFLWKLANLLALITVLSLIIYLTYFCCKIVTLLCIRPDYEYNNPPGWVPAEIVLNNLRSSPSSESLMPPATVQDPAPAEDLVHEQHSDNSAVEFSSSSNSRRSRRSTTNSRRRMS